MAQELEQDASLLQDYLTECDELLQNLDRDLVALESAPEDKELLNSIFRAFHTVKGTSGFLGFTHIVELTHHAEDVLNVLRKGERNVTRPTMDALLGTLDQLREMVGDVRGGEPHTYEIEHLLHDLTQRHFRRAQNPRLRRLLRLLRQTSPPNLPTPVWSVKRIGAVRPCRVRSCCFRAPGEIAARRSPAPSRWLAPSAWMSPSSMN